MRVGGRQVYLIAIFKNILNWGLQGLHYFYSSNLFLMSVNNLFAKILDDPLLMYLYL